MARTTAPRDANRIPTLLGASNDSNETPVVVWADPTTHRLLVDTISADLISDGDVVDAANDGYLMLGSDGSNYQVLATDASGNLQVDIVSGAGGVQYTEGDVDASITGNALMMEGAGNTLVAAPGTAADGLLVNLGANNDVTVSGNVGITGDALTALQNIDADTTTIVGHVDGIEGLLTTIDADTGSIASSASSIDSKVPALGQALAAASVPVVLTAAQLSTLTPLTSVAVTNAGTFAVQVDGSALTALQNIDSDTTSIANSVDGIEGLLTTIDADTSVLAGAVTSSRVQTNLVGAGSNAVIKDDSFYAEDVTSGILAVHARLWDGAAYDRQPGDSTNGMLVNLGANNDVVVSGAILTSIDGHVDGVEGLLTTIDADTSTIAGAVSGTEMQVDVVAALPAGTNNIGDVDVLSIVPGTGATNLGKAEDSAHTSGDVGVMALGVVNDNLTSLAAEGDYIPLATSADGVLYMYHADSPAVRGLHGEDAAASSGDIGMSMLGVRVDTPNTALTNADGDYGAVALNKLGSVRTAIPEDDLATAATNHVKKYYTNAGAVTDGIIWSPAAGKRWFITDIFIQVSAACTVTLEDDLVAGDSAIWKAELGANSGWSHSFATPWFSGEDAADLIITTTAGNVYVTVVGYEI